MHDQDLLMFYSIVRAIVIGGAYYLVLYELASIANSLRSIKITLASVAEDRDDDDE